MNRTIDGRWVLTVAVVCVLLWVLIIASIVEAIR